MPHIWAAPKSLTIAEQCRDARHVTANRGAGSVTPIEAPSSDMTLPSHTRFVGLAAGKSDRPDLQSARRVVSGGRGVGSKESFEIIYKLPTSSAPRGD